MEPSQKTAPIRRQHLAKVMASNHTAGAWESSKVTRRKNYKSLSPHRWVYLVMSSSLLNTQLDGQAAYGNESTSRFIQIASGNDDEPVRLGPARIVRTKRRAKVAYRYGTTMKTTM